MRTRQSVTLRGMRFYTRIGVLPHEAALPQPLEIDLTVWRGGQWQGVLDYSDLYAITEQSVGSGHTRYLEDVADRVVARALELPGATGARVAVRKPHVALPGPLDCAEVVLERERDA